MIRDWCFEWCSSNSLEAKALILSNNELTISRTTKINYSGVWMEIIIKIKNTPFIGGLPIIFAILSNDNWFLLVSDSTID